MKPDPAILTKLRRDIAEIEARKPLNRAEALAVMIRQAGGFVFCGCGCGEVLDPLGEGVRDEHRVALGLTGTNGLPNREWWRLPCAKAKDKLDAGRIAKAKRLAGETCTAPGKPIPQRVNPWPPRGSVKLQSRPFNRKKEKRG